MSKKKKTDPNLPTKQHIFPRSRGGPDEEKNILYGLPLEMHTAWNVLFGNLTPFEVESVLLTHLLQSGTFRSYPKQVTGKIRAPKTLDPDEMILVLVRTVFPKDWTPSEELMNTLKRWKSPPRES